MKITKSNTKITAHGFILTILALIIALILGVSNSYPARAETSSLKITAPIEEQSNDRDVIIQGALFLINQRPDLLNPNYRAYEMGDLIFSEDWAFFNLISHPIASSQDSDNFLAPDVILGLAKKNETDAWEIHLEFSENYPLLLSHIPDMLIPAESRENLLANVQNSISTNATYKITGLPWAVNTSWRYNQGPHGGTQYALDFGVPTAGISNWVKAADAGTVIYRHQTCIGVRRADNLRLWYQHIRPSDISKFNIGNAVTLGQNIGMTTVESGCGGYSTGHHVHFYWDLSSTQPIVAEGTSLNGWTVTGSQLKKHGITLNPNGSHILYSNNPSHPNNVTASDGTYSDSIRISWSTVSGATSYEIWRHTSNSSGGASKITTTTASSYNDTSATPLIPYYYWVKACNNKGCSGFSSSNAGYRGQSGVTIIGRPTLSPPYEGDMCGSGWHQITGFGDEKAFLTLNTNKAGNNNFFGTWQPNLLASGLYKIEAYIPKHGTISWKCPTKTITSDTSNAKYIIYHANGSTEVIKNQASASGTWIDLGTYTFNAGTAGKVGLIDLNNEADLSRTVSFSAIKFTQLPKNNKLTIESTAAHDGWILESSETSNKGGTLNKGATILQLGDDAARKQYLSILSFNTSSIPDDAVITKVTLRVKRQGITGGGNPVNMFQGFMVDIKRGSFGAQALVIGDFQTSANKSYGPFQPTLSDGWYAINLTPGKNFVNKLASGNGLTQIRLRFKLDDNNNGKANFLKLFSGNAPAASRPQLIVEYYVP